MAEAPITARSRLLQRIGASCWRHKVESPAAQEALEKLCRTYWRPIYGFVRRQGVGSEEAKDLTQGFFALLLERRDLNAVRKEKGRLRSYLLTSLKHFLTNEHNRAMAIKRGAGQRLIPLEDLRERERVGYEPSETLAADQIYERRWALSCARPGAWHDWETNIVRLVRRLPDYLISSRNPHG